MLVAKLFSVTEAAELLYVTKPTIHNWVRRGLLKAMSFPNGRKKFTKEQLDVLLQSGNYTQTVSSSVE